MYIYLNTEYGTAPFMEHEISAVQSKESYQLGKSKGEHF
jgi:hypothetical protein